MTKEELQKVPFKFSSHMSMSDHHSATYINKQYGFSMSKHTKKTGEFTFGRTITHYGYNGVTYKSLKKFLEAIKDIKYENES